MTLKYMRLSLPLLFISSRNDLRSNGRNAGCELHIRKILITTGSQKLTRNDYSSLQAKSAVIYLNINPGIG